MQTHRISAEARRLTWTITASLALLSAAHGQTAAPEAQPEPAKKEDVVVLSPFVVDASEDVGYRASNTLAGTRINTSLRDLAAPVSVVTKDFMTDINATDINDILAYQTGSEGMRDFSATVSSLGRTTDDSASSPNTANRGRGLSAYDITRYYFYTISGGVGFDSYNLDSVTISRGPNSILAGLGSPAGIIDYSPQNAQMSRNTTEISYRYGTFGDQRATLDANYALVKDVVGLRLAAVAANEGFEQQPAYAKNRRVYLASTVKPFAKTTVRLSYEWVQLDQRRPNTFTPEDDVSQWLAVGKPTQTNGVFPTGAGGLAALFPNGPTVFYAADGTLIRAVDTTNQKAYYQQNLTGVGLWQGLRMNNDNYGDWHDLNTNGSTNGNKLKTWNFSLDQEIVKNLDFNFAFVREDLTTQNINLFRPDYVTYSVDVNATLPGGGVNPHYGETYLNARGLDNLNHSLVTNEAGRASLAYQLDLTTRNKWYGKYNIVGFGEKRTTESNYFQYNSQAGTAETGRIWYVGGTAANGYRAQTTSSTPLLVSGVPMLLANGTMGTLTDSYVLKSNTKNLTKLTTTAATGQAYLLNNMLVLTGGIRKDVNKAGTVIGTTSPAGDYPPLTEVSATTKSWGAVAHPTKWLDVFYNSSENFVPQAGYVDIQGNAVPSPSGDSKDYGFTLSTPDQKLVAKINWYKTGALNATNSIASGVAQWNMMYLEQGYAPQGRTSPMADLAAQQGIVYKPAYAAGLVTGDPRLTKSYTSDQVSKGIEVELTYNPTKNWRIFGTITKQEATETNIAPGLTAFIKERLAYWQSTPGLWTGQTSTKGWNPLPQTGEQLFNNTALNGYITYQSSEGKPSTQLHEWRATLVNNYTFTDGVLKGFNAGVGLRYIDGAVIGNPVFRNSANQVIGLDTENPYTSSDQIAVDAWIGYKMTLKSKYTLSFQLNAQDLQSDGGYRAVIANSDGNHAVYAIVPPRRFYLTTKLEF